MGFSRTRFGRRLFRAALRWSLLIVGAVVAVGYLSAMDAALAEVRRVARADGRPAVRRMLDEMQTLQAYAWGALGLFSAAYLAVLVLARRLASLADELERLTRTRGRWRKGGSRRARAPAPSRRSARRG